MRSFIWLVLQEYILKYVPAMKTLAFLAMPGRGGA